MNKRYATHTGYVQSRECGYSAIERRQLSSRTFPVSQQSETGSWDIVAMNNGKRSLPNFSDPARFHFMTESVTNEITQRRLLISLFQRITQRRARAQRRPFNDAFA